MIKNIGKLLTPPKARNKMSKKIKIMENAITYGRGIKPKQKEEQVLLLAIDYLASKLTEAEEQIENMKCCGNCNYYKLHGDMIQKCLISKTGKNGHDYCTNWTFDNQQERKQ